MATPSTGNHAPSFLLPNAYKALALLVSLLTPSLPVSDPSSALLGLYHRLGLQWLPAHTHLPYLVIPGHLTGNNLTTSRLSLHHPSMGLPSRISN